MKYEIIKGDLLDLRESVDAIVISNRNRPGIYNAVGYGFWEYCLKLKREELAVGDCKTIQWPKLKSPYVIYVLCPSYKDSLNPKQELVKAYQSVFKEAERQGLKKIAISLLGANYSAGVSLDCAKQAFKEYETETLEAILVLSTVHLKALADEQNVAHYVHIDGAAEKLGKLCEDAMLEKFNKEDVMFERVKTRLNKELEHVTKYGFESFYLHFWELIQKCKLRPSQYYVEGEAASSVICFLLGITKENPLDERMPLYDEFFAGPEGNKQPDIKLRVDARVLGRVIAAVDELPGVQRGWREKGSFLSDGIKILPERDIEYELYELENDMFAIYDIQCGGDCTMLAELEERTGYYVENADIREKLYKRQKTIFTMEELFEKLVECGMERKQALLTSETIRGWCGTKRNKFEKYEGLMKEFKIPPEIIYACLTSKYLYSRAHVAERLQCEIRWKYYTEEYGEEVMKVLRGE